MVISAPTSCSHLSTPSYNHQEALCHKVLKLRIGQRRRDRTPCTMFAQLVKSVSIPGIFQFAWYNFYDTQWHCQHCSLSVCTDLFVCTKVYFYLQELKQPLHDTSPKTTKRKKNQELLYHLTGCTKKLRFILTQPSAPPRRGLVVSYCLCFYLIFIFSETFGQPYNRNCMDFVCM